uniref:Uncharacterized protein n=1 Tax=Romanomermis culicivorax TaxID=13658 RepID=A0A915K9Q3_ROMCU
MKMMKITSPEEGPLTWWRLFTFKPVIDSQKIFFATSNEQMLGSRICWGQESAEGQSKSNGSQDIPTKPPVHVCLLPIDFWQRGANKT